MPPSLENPSGYPSPNQQSNPEKYHDLELGDLYGHPQSNQPSGGNQYTQPGSRRQPPQQSKPVAPDPVDIVKAMLSAGFIPTKSQIMNASNSLKGPLDSSNTWLAFLLRRLFNNENRKNKRK